MVHNIIILILLIVVLIFFIGLIIFINYCIQYLCTAPTVTNEEKAKKIFGLSKMRKIRDRHLQNVK